MLQRFGDVAVDPSRVLLVSKNFRHGSDDVEGDFGSAVAIAPEGGEEMVVAISDLSAESLLEHFDSESPRKPGIVAEPAGAGWTLLNILIPVPGDVLYVGAYIRWDGKRVLGWQIQRPEELGPDVSGNDLSSISESTSAGSCPVSPGGME